MSVPSYVFVLIVIAAIVVTISLPVLAVIAVRAQVRIARALEERDRRAE